MTLRQDATFGPYRVGAALGRGGMGVVYEAVDERLGRRVALKVVPADVAARSLRDRFLAESRAAASIDHPNVIPVYEAGEHDGMLFIAMRLVPGGRDLDVILREAQRLEPTRAVAIVGQVAEALDAAHAAGLIHRDVKPGNVLVTSAGDREHAYLSDFGLARERAYVGGLTRTGELLGTVDYLAPEVIEGRPIDARVDVYSLGCLLYETLVGSPPYRRESDVASLYAHIHAPVPSVHSARPEIAAEMDDVMTRALAKDPDARYASAGELAAAAASAIGVRNEPTALTPEVARRRVARFRRRQVMAGMGVALAVIVLAGAGAGALALRGGAVGGTGGDRIVFSRQVSLASTDSSEPVACDGYTDAKLVMIDPDDPAAPPRRLTSLTDLYEQSPSWSLDGNTIAFTGQVQNRGAGIFATRPDGTTLLEVVQGNPWIYQRELDPRVSPDGRHVLWLTGEGLTVAAVDGSGVARVLGRGPEDPPPDSRDEFAVPLAADWMPDGRIAAITGATGEEGYWEPGLPRRLETLTRTGEDRQPLPLDLAGFMPERLSIAPDGKRLAFVDVGLPDPNAPEPPPDEEPPPPVFRLVVAGLPDGAPVPVDGIEPALARPAWSPDGTRLVLGGADGQLWTAPAAGGTPTRLTDLRDAIACNPAWGTSTVALPGPRPSSSPGTVQWLERGYSPAGRYLAHRPQPPMEITLPEAMNVRRNYPDGFAIAPLGDPVGEVDSGLISVGLSGPCIDSPQVVLGPRPQDLVDWLEARSDLVLSNPSAINVGGYPGLSIDVARDPADGCAGTDDDTTYLYRSGQDVSWLGPGETLRLVAVDVRGTTMTLQVFAVDGATDRMHALGQAMIESVTFPSSLPSPGAHRVPAPGAG